MTETHIDDGITGSVYQVHKAHVLGDVLSRDAERVEHPIKYPQGHYIDQMKEHSEIVILNDDATTMNCATFTDFELLCNHIGDEIEIRIDRVYPALRYIGYNMRYHTMRLNGGDVFTEIKEFVRRFRSSMDRDMLLTVSSGTPIFHDVKMKKVRVSKQTSTITIDDAADAGIRTSDLNLYLALTGLKTIVENEPYYILHRSDDLIVDVLRILNKADKSLLHRKETLGWGLRI